MEPQKQQSDALLGYYRLRDKAEECAHMLQSVHYQLSLIRREARVVLDAEALRAKRIADEAVTKTRSQRAKTPYWSFSPASEQALQQLKKQETPLMDQQHRIRSIYDTCLLYMHRFAQSHAGILGNGEEHLPLETEIVALQKEIDDLSHADSRERRNDL